MQPSREFDEENVKSFDDLYDLDEQFAEIERAILNRADEWPEDGNGD